MLLASSDMPHPLNVWSGKSCRITARVATREIERSFHRHGEKLLRHHHAGRQTLLVDIVADRLPGRPVGLDSIGPEILTEHPPGLFYVVDEERKCEPQRVGVVETVHGDGFGFGERLVNALRNPGMFAVDVLADDEV